MPPAAQAAEAVPLPNGTVEPTVGPAEDDAGSPAFPTRLVALVLAVFGVILIVSGLAFSHLPSPLVDLVYEVNGHASEAVVGTPRNPTTTTTITTSTSSTRSRSRSSFGAETESSAGIEQASVRRDPGALVLGPGRWMMLGVLLCAVAVVMWRRARTPPERRTWLGPLCWGVGVVWAAFVVAGAMEVWRRDERAEWLLAAIPVPRLWTRPLELVAVLSVLFVVLVTVTAVRNARSASTHRSAAIAERVAAGVETSFGVDDATTRVVQELASGGAAVTSASSGLVTGTLTTKQRPNLLIAVLLWFICIVPMIIYVVMAAKDVSEPFSIRLEPTGTGTRFHPTGRGAALEAALTACEAVSLATAPSPVP